MLIDVRNDTELFDVAKLFFCGDDIPSICLEVDGKNNDFFVVTINGNSYKFRYDGDSYAIIPPAHRISRLSKIAVYDALHCFTSRSMPWGALTGVRPSKLFYEAIRQGKSHEQAIEYMKSVYRVSEKRAKILSEIALAQSGKLFFSPEYYNLYVHVPYCTTRCSYCSFVSLPIGKYSRQSQDYVALLCDEIIESKKMLAEHGKKLLSVYIGGGTPSALDDDSFDKLLSAIGNPDCEYTCEAGRPDTVTPIKAEIMKKHGVTRVCVNPQTLNDKTLVTIGRSHTAAEFYSAYDTVKSFGFDINCDLIAGLDSETIDDFKYSLDGIRALEPQNITVHSLSKKNGSCIRYNTGENENTSAMTEYALANLTEYRPYYLYRQKRQSGNLENIGFSLRGHECINNITTMEETVGVMACGAGAISKFVDGNSIVRFANMRDVPLYISRYDEKLAAKSDCFLASIDKKG